MVSVITTSLLPALRPFGVGISRALKLRLQDCCSSLLTAEVVASTEAIPCDRVLALFPDNALWTVSAMVDLDVDGLVPPAADMVELLGDAAGEELDVIFAAYCLSLRCFTHADCWFSYRVRSTLALSASAQVHEAVPISSGAATAATLHDIFSEKYVTAPPEVLAAALQYVRTSHLRRHGFQDSQQQQQLEGKEAQRPSLCLVPLMDVMIASSQQPSSEHEGRQCNVTLRACTVKDTAKLMSESPLVGARQYLRKKEEGYTYWALTATKDLTAGEVLVAPRDIYCFSSSQ